MSGRQHISRSFGPQILGLALCAWLTTPATAQERAVDLELILAADISRSMDEEEANLVRQGFVNAIRHPKVIEAIGQGYHGRIAVTYVEWAGAHHQQTLVDWMEIADAAGAKAFADTLEKAPMMGARRTSISGAINYGAARFEGNGFNGKRKVIDISGDGANNSGDYVPEARDRAIARGITINGLPIINDDSEMWGYPRIPNLDLYYEDCVIGGFGAFMVVAEGFDDFARAILKKMITEIAGHQPKPKLIWQVAERVRPPCNAGEIRLRQWLEQQNWE